MFSSSFIRMLSLTKVMRLLKIVWNYWKSCPAQVLICWSQYHQRYVYLFLKGTDCVYCRFLIKFVFCEILGGKILSACLFGQTIHSELLLHYHSKKERVEEGICQLINVLERKNNKPQKLDSPPKREDIVSLPLLLMRFVCDFCLYYLSML